MDTTFMVLSWCLCGLGAILVVLGNLGNSDRLVRLGVIVSSANVILCSVYLALRISAVTAG